MNKPMELPNLKYKAPKIYYSNVLVDNDNDCELWLRVEFIPLDNLNKVMVNVFYDRSNSWKVFTSQFDRNDPWLHHQISKYIKRYLASLILKLDNPIHMTDTSAIFNGTLAYKLELLGINTKIM